MADAPRKRSPSPRRARSRSHSRSRSRSLTPQRYRSRSRSRSRSASRGGRHEDANPGNTLFVTGLSSRVTQRDLEDHFSKEGRVSSVFLVVEPRTRISRGFAFVTMDTLEDADRCIKYLNQSVLEGRYITVEKSRRKRPRTPTPGHYLGLGKPRESGYRGRSRGGGGTVGKTMTTEDHQDDHHLIEAVEATPLLAVHLMQKGQGDTDLGLTPLMEALNEGDMVVALACMPDKYMHRTLGHPENGLRFSEVTGHRM